ncbi:MAG TPA: hypothetical protein PK995_08600 [Bacteroidia bacterium]|nr:hypothetical protein [Bacteroidia bacterium]
MQTKKFFIFLIFIVCNELSFCQNKDYENESDIENIIVDEIGNENRNEKIYLKKFVINDTIKSILEIVVKDCISDKDLSKFSYDFLILTKKRENHYSIIITPQILESYKGAYGFFEVLDKKFICIGDKLDGILKCSNDSFEFSNKVYKFYVDSVIREFYISPYIDVNTESYVLRFCKYNTKFIFQIQPCNYLNRKKIKRLIKKYECLNKD